MYKIKMLFPVIFIVYIGLIIPHVYGSDTELNVLNVYTWVDYIDPEIFSDFEKEFHVKVHVDFYDDEEAMFSLVQSQPERYDIIFPSDSLTDVMIKSKLLSRLDMHHIPNMKNLKARFRTITNRKWKGYSVPIDWGVTGIAYNTKYVTGPVDSWSIFWDTKYRGKMALSNNMYDVMTVGLKRLGYSLKPTNPKDVDESLKILKVLKPLLQKERFLPYNKIDEGLISEALWIAQCYNGDAAFVNEKNDAIKFILPKDGTGFWMDNIAVTIGAKHKRLAEKFINFILRPEVSGKHTNYSYYASCNKRAWAFVHKEMLKNPYIYIHGKVIDTLEVYEILNPDVQKKFNECWAKLVSD